MESAEKEFRILESLRCDTDKVYHHWLYQYQNAGVELILDNLSRLSFCILADSVGVGKTCQAIVACGLIGRRTLVVVPKMLLIKWQREVEKFGVGAKASIVTKLGDFERATGLFVITSYDFIKLHVAKFHRYDFKVIVFDECQFLKSSESSRTKRLLPFAVDKKVICITATPFTKAPTDVWPILYYLCPQAIDGAGYYAFALRYMHKVVDAYGHEMFRGGRNLQELGQRLRCYGMIRRTKEKVLPYLPKFSIEVVELETGYKRKAFDRLDFVGETLDIPIDEISTARAEYAEAKKSQALDFVKLMLENEEKIVIFAHHKVMVDHLVTELKCLKIDGSMSQSERQKSLDSFQNDPEEFAIVCSISACAFGIELTASSIAIFVEYSWSAEENAQALGRLVRIGQPKHTNCYYTVCKDTMDAYMIKKCLEKERVSNNILKN